MPPSQITFTDLKSQVAASKQPGIVSTKPKGKERDKDSKSDWLKKNKDTNKRVARNIELRDAELDRRSHEDIRAKLEKKAKQYRQLKRGLTGGLTEAQLAEQAVDWDAKEADNHYSSDSDDVDESLTVPQREEGMNDDPIMEYTDELGRQRSARRSEIPRQFLPKDDEDDDGIVIENAHNYFPTYEPSAERLRKIKELSKEEDVEAHYDSSRNIRDHGAAFYRFSGDKDQRASERAELERLHAETQATRAQAGAVDIKPGVEGMQAEEQASSKAVDKRKREREDRLKAIQAKRSKLVHHGVTAAELPSSSTTTAPSVQPEPLATLKAGTQQLKAESKAKKEQLDAADAFLANLELEAQIKHK